MSHRCPFQFTRARGARLVAERDGVPRIVSIHARTGRATMTLETATETLLFQFTRARGARPDPSNMVDVVVEFQFTRARGARQVKRPIKCGRGSRFNSRAHGARDFLSSPPQPLHNMFQFTRARGARQFSGTVKPPRACFNSRAHGARDIRANADGAEQGLGFNSRAHGARDSAKTGANCSGHRFNSRAHGARDKSRRLTDW